MKLEVCFRITLIVGLWADNFESLEPAAFVFGNIDIAFGIHGGTDGIKELALEEKPRTMSDR